MNISKGNKALTWALWQYTDPLGFATAHVRARTREPLQCHSAQLGCIASFAFFKACILTDFICHALAFTDGEVSPHTFSLLPASCEGTQELTVAAQSLAGEDPIHSLELRNKIVR